VPLIERLNSVLFWVSKCKSWFGNGSQLMFSENVSLV